MSEFSFGFAVTDEILRQQRPNITAAPQFPSLREEAEGGYDLRLDRKSIPLFLQFKLSNRMVKRNCNEARAGHFAPPFFRIKLMPLKLSQQHHLLLDLDDGSNEVYYAAPLFISQSELNNHYLSNQVLANSVFIRPSSIGRLPDNKDHHLSFNPSVTQTRMYSKEGKLVESVQDGNTLSSNIKSALAQKGEPLQSILPKLYARLESISTLRKISDRKVFEKARMENNLLSSTINMARYHLGCELIFVQQESEEA